MSRRTATAAQLPSPETLTIPIAIPMSALTVVAAPPAYLSQHTVQAHTGIHPRAYLEAIRAPGFPLAVSALGKLRLVDCGAFVAWLRARGAEAPAADADDITGDVEALLGSLGRTLTTTGRRALAKAGKKGGR
jgi:hypothetical protein